MNLTMRIALLLSFFLLPLAAHAQWEKFDVGTDAGFRGLDVVSPNVVWASGTGGTYIRTTDGGRSWKVGRVEGAEELDFRDIEAFDERTAYVLSIGNGANSRIYKTTDGGESWKLQFTNTDEKAFFDSIAFWDEKNGLAMSDPVGGKYVLYRTEDGETWQKVSTDSMPSAGEGEAAFAASGTCLVTAGKDRVWLVTGGTDARVFYSKDRGRTWDVAETPIVKGAPGSGIFSIDMWDEKRGVIVGGNYQKPDESGANLAFTKDGGKTWTAGTGLSGYRSGVVHVDKKMLVAVGTNGYDLSLDGGRGWVRYQTEGGPITGFNAVDARDRNSVWAVGANGLVARYVYKVTR